MGLVTILLIALGLSMDAFAVAIAAGLAMKQMRIRHALFIGASFGAFQAIMPVIGWAAGLTFQAPLRSVDHWIAFALLLAIGGKMIWEALTLQDEEKKTDYTNLGVILILSVATSIDALAVGLSFAFLDVAIATPALLIGVVTFGLSTLGVFIGGRFGHLFESRIEILGGLILIGIGLKILLDHTGVL